jgi:hypothetical protein
MNPQLFAKVAGIVQALVGVGGAAVPALGGVLGAGAGGSGFNILSGALLSYLGFKGSAANQKLGAQGLGAVNLVVGILGALGVQNLAGIPLNSGTVAIAINVIIGVWGLLAGFLGKKKAA